MTFFIKRQNIMITQYKMQERNEKIFLRHFICNRFQRGRFPSIRFANFIAKLFLYLSMQLIGIKSFL